MQQPHGFQLTEKLYPLLLLPDIPVVSPERNRLVLLKKPL